MGVQWGSQNGQKSVQMCKSGPRSAVCDGILSRPWKNIENSYFEGTLEPSKWGWDSSESTVFTFGIGRWKHPKKISKMVSFGDRFGTGSSSSRNKSLLWVFWGQPKISCFFWRVPLLVLVRKYLQKVMWQASLFDPFWGPFSRGHPPPSKVP